MYSDYALQHYHKEKVESESYRCCQVGPREWTCIRNGIVTDKVRHVTLSLDGSLGCDCLLMEEAGFMCRHMLALCSSVPRLIHLLSKPVSDVWLNSKYIEAFQDFHVIMPSETEIYNCSGNMFPGPINMPKKVKSRGRPKVKRFRKEDRQFRAKMRKRTGDGDNDKRRQCALCRGVGHFITRCPVRQMFRCAT